MRKRGTTWIAVVGVIVGVVSTSTVHAFAEPQADKRCAAATGQVTRLKSVATVPQSGVAWVVGDSGARYSVERTHDGGANWTRHYVPGVQCALMNGVALWGPHHSMVTIVGQQMVPVSSQTGNPALIMTSANNGTSWNVIQVSPNARLQGISFGSMTSGITVGTDTASDTPHPIALWTDDGKKWHPAKGLPRTGTLVGVSSGDAQRAWAYGYDELYHPILVVTSDGGRTWKTVSAPAHTQFIGGASALGARDVWLTINTAKSGFVLHKNGSGPGTKEATSNLQNVPVAFTDIHNGCAMGVGADGAETALVTTTGGSSWAAYPVNPPSPTVPHAMSISFSTPTDGFFVGVDRQAGGVEGLIYRTTNSGQGWTEVWHGES